LNQEAAPGARPPGRAFFFPAAGLAIAACAAAAAWWLHVPSTYFTREEVDHVAAPLKAVDLQFPQSGPEMYGTLRMNVFISEKGAVDRVEVLESTVPPSFRNYAVDVFTATRFDPAQRGGRAVKSVKKVEVIFAPPPRPALSPGR
jgi:TonB family protein